MIRSRGRSPGWELHGEQEEGIFLAVTESAAARRWVLGLSLPGDGEARSEPRCREVGMMNGVMGMVSSRDEVLLI